MKAQDIANRLYDCLPQRSDLFTSSVDVISITNASGTTATATTATPHGLATNDLVTISGALAPCPVDTLTRNGTVASATTSLNHDLTLGYQENVVIDGANEAEFNGEFKLLSVPNRRNFTFEVSDTGPTVGSGNISLLNGLAYGFNGLYQVTVLSDTVFTYELPVALGVDASGDIKANVGFRITAAATFERAQDMYTRQQVNELWAFVVLGNVTASKSRKNENDSVATFSANSSFRQDLIFPFSVFVFAPAKDQISGRAVRDLMEDVAVDLMKCLAGYKIDNGFFGDPNYRIAFDSHGIQAYNSAYYVHRYNFQSFSQIVAEDAAIESFNVAFRDIDFEMATNLMTGDTTRLTASIDLDEEPLSS